MQKMFEVLNKIPKKHALGSFGLYHKVGMRQSLRPPKEVV